MQSFKLFRTFITLGLLTGLSLAAEGDKIHLKNGQYLTGNIIFRDSKMITMQVPVGVGSIEIGIEASDVERIKEALVEEPDPRRITYGGISTRSPVDPDAGTPSGEELSPETAMYYDQLRSEITQERKQRAGRVKDLKKKISRFKREAVQAPTLTRRREIEIRVRHLEQEKYQLSGVLSATPSAPGKGNARDKYFEELEIQNRQDTVDRRRQKKVLNDRIHDLQKELRGNSKVMERKEIQRRIDRLKEQKKALHR